MRRWRVQIARDPFFRVSFLYVQRRQRRRRSHARHYMQLKLCSTLHHISPLSPVLDCCFGFTAVS
jgi:hypothetical protein